MAFWDLFTKTSNSQSNLLSQLNEAKRQLEAERDRIAAIITSMGEGLLVVDSQTRLSHINPAAQKLLEVTADQVLGKPWSEIVTTLKGDSPVPTHERSFTRVLEKGKTIVTSLKDNHSYKTHSGKVFPVASITAPLKDKNGHIIGGVKVFRDISHERLEKRVIEATVDQRTKQLLEKNLALEQAHQQISEGWMQLQQEKARLSASLHNLPLGFILTDLAGSVIDINSIAKKILEVSPPPRTLATVAEALHLPLTQYLHDCCASKSPIEIKSIAYGSLTLHLFISPILLPSGPQSCIGSVVLIEDITEAKILERSKDEFFSIASHELRTPLTAIRGNAALILEHYHHTLSDPTFKDMLVDIHDASVRLIGIVNDFLNVSRLEQGKIEFNTSPFDIYALARQVVEELSATASQTHLSLTVSPPSSPLPRVSADADKTKEVLVNLIGNGLKFTHTGGVTVSFRLLDGYVETQITDTGRGIPLENQPLLFHKFQQAGSSLYTRDTTKGTGLGLYVSKLLVEGMKGRIYLVSSTPELGSTFAFTLPSAKTPSP